MQRSISNHKMQNIGDAIPNSCKDLAKQVLTMLELVNNIIKHQTLMLIHPVLRLGFRCIYDNEDSAKSELPCLDGVNLIGWLAWA